MNKFKICIYECFNYENKTISHKALTDLESYYLNQFDIDTLYNYSHKAVSTQGYKHTSVSLTKMKERYKDITHHPMYGKNHTKESLDLISKPGVLNPMFGKKHSDKTKLLISKKKNKYPLGIGLYDLDSNLIGKFVNTIVLAKYLNISKVTVSKYLNLGKVYNNKYLLKPIEK